jgi:hypothetical protein
LIFFSIFIYFKILEKKHQKREKEKNRRKKEKETIEKREPVVGTAQHHRLVCGAP